MVEITEMDSIKANFESINSWWLNISIDETKKEVTIYHHDHVDIIIKYTEIKRQD